MSGGWIMQADRAVAVESRFRASRHPGGPPGHPADRVGRRPVRRSPVRPHSLRRGRRGPFAAWRQALGLDDVPQTASGTGTPVYLLLACPRRRRGPRHRDRLRRRGDSGEPARRRRRAAQRRPAARPAGQAVAAVRPEFRADELAFDPGDPVFGGKPCLVPGCERTACGHGLCQGHRQRWAAAGRPTWPGIRRIGRSPVAGKDAPLTRCRAPGCRYGVTRRKGLCARHAGAWERAAMPDLQAGSAPCRAPPRPARQRTA